MMENKMILVLVAVLVAVLAPGVLSARSAMYGEQAEIPVKRFNEFVELPGFNVRESRLLKVPHEYMTSEELPQSWNWGNIDGSSYLTKSLNQHIPQYCGSCWAHGALSALADRIKIARKGAGVDVNLAIQYILNCGTEVAGSCHGGSAGGTYQFIKDSGFVPYDTCQQYAACSAESDEDSCGSKEDYTCKPINVCRTCSTFKSMGGFCSALDTFPNATIAEYGDVMGEKKMMMEIYKRGPIACAVDADPLDKYTGGVLDVTGADETNHIISVVGWGEEADTKKPYWIVRNSWGEYWGEMGYFRVKRGENQLGIESACSWATPDEWTEINVGCFEDGSNCVSKNKYEDPALAYV